jgi:hypothetical protein
MSLPDDPPIWASDSNTSSVSSGSRSRMTPSAATIEIIEQRLSGQADTKARRPMVKIAVAGGTGLVGRQTVEAVRCHGHDPLVLTRSAAWT